MALLGVILNPFSVSFAVVDCISFSNSTKAMSCRPGTSRTSLNPGNLHEQAKQFCCILAHTHYIKMYKYV